MRTLLWRCPKLPDCGHAGGQVFVGIAIPVGADDPDFLAAQLLAQGFQYRHLVGNAIDAIATGSILLHYGIAPEAANDTVERHLLVSGEGAYLGNRPT